MDFDRLKTMLGSADRIKELIGKREKLSADLVKVDEELQQLVGSDAPPPTTRAKQKCSFVLPDGTKCGSTEHTKRTHPTGAANGAA